LDSKRSTRSDFPGDGNPSLERLLAGWRNFLHHAHAECFFGAPMLPGQHVAHSISPSGLAHEADRRATAREPAVRSLILPKARVRGGYADICSEKQLMAHVPSVAVSDDDKRLRARGSRLRQRIDRGALLRARSV